VDGHGAGSFVEKEGFRCDGEGGEEGEDGEDGMSIRDGQERKGDFAKSRESFGDKTFYE
jgi:hypothetical protein